MASYDGTAVALWIAELIAVSVERAYEEVENAEVLHGVNLLKDQLMKRLDEYATATH